MNKVYTATGDEDYGCIYIAAKNGKEAKNIALGTWIAETVDNPYIDIRILRKWGIETEYEGELDIFQINKLGLTWWACPNCDKEKFNILDNEEEYECKNCKQVFKIPYVDV